MIFYDFEVFRYDWLVVLINPEEDDKTVIVNNNQKLKDFFEAHKTDIWIGYNSHHYDVFILKSILLDLNPKECNDFIIVDHKEGYKFTNLFNRITVFDYDVMNSLDKSLKYYEGSMGNSIQESGVRFDINRKLTDNEIQETIKYCTHDVEQTIECFLQTYADFESQLKLMNMFNLPLSAISKTKAQISAMILDAKKTKFNDEFDITFPTTLKLDKYKEVKAWYENPLNRSYSKNLKINVAGVPHVFGWGGVHGARENYFDEGYFINMDVASLYPSIMINYHLTSRACDPTKFKDIVNLRLKYKKEKNPMQAPLKIVINGTYGASKDKFNPLYDPLMANCVCIYGQLLILDLIEKLEPYGEIIQSNTDGVLIKVEDSDEAYQKIDDIAYEWENRTGLKLEFDEYVKIVQKDVNNYILVAPDGHVKTKGAYVQKLDSLNYDLAIVNKAIIDKLINKIPVEDTINNCTSLRDFQLVKKITNKYAYLLHGDEKIDEKCVRVFASNDPLDAGLYKVHASRFTRAKVENTPEHCFFMNGDINEVEIPKKLDKQWYIDLAKKRVYDFLF